MILEKLDALRKADPKLRVFGADGHRYQLARPLPEAVVRSFEERHRISLPSDYREFLCSIANGGAGPFYGVFPLGEMDGVPGLESWSERTGLVGTLSKPFPYTEAWNLPEAERTPPAEFESEAAEDAWVAALEAKCWRQVDGAIPICHHGCALRTWLVVSGTERGHVWYDGTAEYDGWTPLSAPGSERLTFSEWYESWLDDELSNVRDARC